MTDSAKQDTKKSPAQTAEAGSAAAGETDAEAPTENTEATSAADDAAGDSGDKPALDDMKAKFRAALDRKRQVHAEGQGKGAHEAGKVSGAHGPAASRRNFRRKSG
jgi:hypothetical protein